MKYIVEVKDFNNNEIISKEEFATREEAIIAIEEAIDADMENGEYEDYDYYLNGELMD